MENDCRNWLRNPCAGFFREHLAFGARSKPTGLQFWLDCSFRSENVEKHFLSMPNSFPAHIPKQGPLNPINSQRQSSSQSYGYILPTAFTDIVLWTISVQPGPKAVMGMRSIVTGVLLDEPNTGCIGKRATTSLIAGTNDVDGKHMFLLADFVNSTAQEFFNQRILPFKTSVAAGTSSRSFAEELDQQWLSHA